MVIVGRNRGMARVAQESARIGGFIWWNNSEKGVGEKTREEVEAFITHRRATVCQG